MCNRHVTQILHELTIDKQKPALRQFYSTWKGDQFSSTGQGITDSPSRLRIEFGAPDRPAADQERANLELRREYTISVRKTQNIFKIFAAQKAVVARGGGHGSGFNYAKLSMRQNKNVTIWSEYPALQFLIRAI
jgi:hypothetical protein